MPSTSVYVLKLSSTSPSKSRRKRVHDLPFAPVPTKQTKSREKKDALVTSAENNEVTKKRKLSRRGKMKKKV